jgi:lysophospholipase L1-like esterase
MSESAKANPRIVFFGDSICVGQGVSIHRGWVTRLAARIEQWSRESNLDLVIVNASINGNTTRQALERMPYDVQSHGVGVLIVQFGMNDCNYWMTDRGVPRVSEEAFAANLNEVIRRGMTFGAKSILLHTNHATSRDVEKLPYSDITYEASNRRYNEVIREVAARWADIVTLIDIERAFLAHTQGDTMRLAELLLEDGLHLSVKGHDLYYELAAPIIEACVRKVYTERA